MLWGLNRAERLPCFWSLFTLTQSVLDYAILSQVQLCRDYALFGGALWAKICWLGAHKHFWGPGIGLPRMRKPSMIANAICSINCLINCSSHQNWFSSVSAGWQCHANPSCQNSQGMAVQTPFLKKPKFSTFVYTHKVLLEVCLIDQFT